jgi:LSD1 subclass zinc finger protein
MIDATTENMEKVRCIGCSRPVGFAEGKASFRCRHCKTVTLYVEGEVTGLPLMRIPSHTIHATA